MTSSARLRRVDSTIRPSALGGRYGLALDQNIFADLLFICLGKRKDTARVAPYSTRRFDLDDFGVRRDTADIASNLDLAAAQNVSGYRNLTSAIESGF